MTPGPRTLSNHMPLIFWKHAGKKILLRSTEDGLSLYKELDSEGPRSTFLCKPGFKVKQLDSFGVMARASVTKCRRRRITSRR
jgi:hypothetical protein